MRLVALIVLWCSLLGFGLAQLPPGTPSCALPCFIKGVASSPCGTNATCLCADSGFASSLLDCVQTTCEVEDILRLKNATSTACGLPVQNVAAQYSIISHTLTALVFVFVTVRIVYKQFLTSLGLGADDWVIIIVAALVIPSSALNSRIAASGVGRDIWTLTPEQITDFGICLWTITLLYYIEIALLKISILLFYLRVFPQQNFRRVVWATLAFTACFGLAFILAQIFKCWPISYDWRQWNDRGSINGQGPGGKCVSTIAVARSHGIIGIALDVWMLLLPLQKVRELKVSSKRKLAIASMFAVGTFVTVVTVVRLAYLVIFANSNNPTYDYTALLVWSTIEIATGVICACMPALRLILAKIWPLVFDTKNTRQAKYADQYIFPANRSLPPNRAQQSQLTAGTTTTISSTTRAEQKILGSRSSIGSNSSAVLNQHPAATGAWKSGGTFSILGHHNGVGRTTSDSPFSNFKGGSGRAALQRIDSSEEDEGNSTEMQPTRRTTPQSGALNLPTSRFAGGWNQAGSLASNPKNDSRGHVVREGPLGISTVRGGSK